MSSEKGLQQTEKALPLADEAATPEAQTVSSSLHKSNNPTFDAHRTVSRLLSVLLKVCGGSLSLLASSPKPSCLLLTTPSSPTYSLKSSKAFLVVLISYHGCRLRLLWVGLRALLSGLSIHFHIELY